MFLAILFFLSATSSANGHTGQWFKKSAITVTEQSEVPGMVLETGSYVFKADGISNNRRTTVELWNQDETQVLTSFIAVPDHRQRPETGANISFYEGITSGPQAIQTWYSPGDMDGYEFVYPKTRAREIAKASGVHVMASDSTDAEIVAITSNGTEVPIFASLTNGKTKVTTSEPAQREKPRGQPPSTAPADRTKERIPPG